MCLGIPGQVIELLEGYGGQLALVDVEGAQRKVNIGMLELDQQALHPGDWVLIHMGFAVEKVDAAGAREALAGLEMMGRARDRRVRRRVDVRGVVQGVGFRPFVYAQASRFGLTGWVRNDATGVVIEVEGDGDDVGSFVQAMRDDAPPLAMVEAVSTQDIGVEGGSGFTIGATHASEAVRTLASPDIAMCADCETELLDPTDRRHRHPFITCTNCGPRFTIITSLPYDRPTTTMAGFAMCATCTRRVHRPGRPTLPRPDRSPAPDCGPRLELVDPAGGSCDGEEALAAARRRLAAGCVVAIKGIGGYHLACDATNAAAVAELRRRKQRGAKPFAVMVPDLATAESWSTSSPPAAALLTGTRRPVVVLPDVRWTRQARWSALTSPRATPTSASCCPTRRCTACCSGSTATPPARPSSS